ncbi:12512_t:CDS:2 [Funneliformis geosporum]|uniref:12512_t:CDS:1 n=1 Tax=Funneliformis geosporum TaxID=1117311 RepID=A0A9W4SEB0_9GLOM|nr:12512_t:CDS:2 [Funneliformis geosporum]
MFTKVKCIDDIWCDKSSNIYVSIGAIMVIRDYDPSGFRTKPVSIKLVVNVTQDFENINVNAT